MGPLNGAIGCWGPGGARARARLLSLPRRREELAGGATRWRSWAEGAEPGCRGGAGLRGAELGCGGRSWAAGAGRSLQRLWRSGRLATGPRGVRTEARNQSGCPGQTIPATGGRAASSLPLPLRPPDLRSGGGLGTVRCPGPSRVRTAAPKTPLRGPVRGWGLPSSVGRGHSSRGPSCQPL